MSGQTLTVSVASAVDSTRPFIERTHSAPDLLSSLSNRPASLAQASYQEHLKTKALPSLPAFDVSSIDLDSDFDLHITIKDPRVSANETPPRLEAEELSVGSKPHDDDMPRRRTTLSRPQSWLSIARPSIGSRKSFDDNSETAKADGKEQEAKEPDSLEPSLMEKPSGGLSAFTSLAKRSWRPNTPSPSPERQNEDKGKNKEKEVDRETRMSRRLSGSSTTFSLKGKHSRKPSGSPAGSERTKSSESLAKLGTYLNKIKQRPQNKFVKETLNHDADSLASSTNSLAPPATEPRTSQSHSSSENSNSSAPDDQFLSPNTPRNKDPLWSAFKNIESEYDKVQGKTSHLKMTSVQTLLLPFLRKYSHNPVNQKLHPEALERRAKILSRWWVGLLEVLEAKTQNAVSGVERPLLLEAIGLIMVRPEWRQCTPTFQALEDRSPSERVKNRSRSRSRNSASEDSSISGDSAFIAESAEHNVRTMFISNLISQMVVLVEKLSMRHTPSSLVNFAGKACAYAFFFAPGVANILVRLWNLMPDLLRRVADEFNLPRRSKGEEDDMVALFPPVLHDLGWSSSKTMIASLRRPASVPVALAKIQWHGAWSSRWQGRDTDLFFVFCKYYHTLAEEFMPYGLPLIEKARAPAFVLVHAQILANLDSTIHRQAAVEAMMGPPLADVAHGGDATLLAMPVAPNNNVLMGMDENRLVMLLKDFVSEDSMGLERASDTFAQAFMADMKAAAKKTSQYDHNACFTVCDFLEESLTTLQDYAQYKQSAAGFINWSFWMEVCARISESNNTMSEIRVLCLLFTIWDIIEVDEQRKEAFCLHWLLEEATFDKFFNNWCPMVRAYYMRLLCWRMCRYTGSATPTDTEIFKLLSQRLQKNWAHYLWLQQSAEEADRLPPSTAPSFPTPGKRFMIIRTEIAKPQPGLLMGFDAPSGPDSRISPSSELPNPFDDASFGGSDKKKWSLFGKVLSFSGSTSMANDLEAVRRDTAAARTKQVEPLRPSSATDSLGSSPLYEAAEYSFRFQLTWNQPGTLPPAPRVLAKPRLPGPAQASLSTRSRSQSPSPAQELRERIAPMRTVSGGTLTGLVAEAKNADPSASPATPEPRPLSSPERRFSDESSGSAGIADDAELGRLYRSVYSPGSTVEPLQPTGNFTINATYTGRALAEWSLVVNECNSFIDRRRDEGVFELKDIEIPSLSVEGFKKIG